MFTAALAPALAPYATAIGIGGAAISAIGTINAANAAAAASEYNAALADRDAEVARQNSAAAISQAQIDADAKRSESKRVLASMRASYGASGIELAGSPLDVLYDTAAEQETDARRIEYEGQIRGREGALQMLGLSESATLSRMEADATRSAGYVGAAGSLASGAGTSLARMG